jgi:hypothetical protein
VPIPVPKLVPELVSEWHSTARPATFLSAA